MTTYQNFPCEFNSLGSMPSTATLGHNASSGLVARSAGPLVAQSAAISAARVEHVAKTTTSGAGQPVPGMAEAEVRKIWGEPDEIVQDEPPSGRVDIWHYRDGRSVYIRKHKVVTE